MQKWPKKVPVRLLFDSVEYKSPCALEMTSEVKFDAKRQNLASDVKLWRYIRNLEGSNGWTHLWRQNLTLASKFDGSQILIESVKNFTSSNKYIMSNINIWHSFWLSFWCQKSLLDLCSQKIRGPGSNILHSLSTNWLTPSKLDVHEYFNDPSRSLT